MDGSPDMDMLWRLWLSFGEEAKRHVSLGARSRGAFRRSLDAIRAAQARQDLFGILQSAAHQVVSQRHEAINRLKQGLTFTFAPPAPLPR